jgi:hypothetical protein
MLWSFRLKIITSQSRGKEECEKPELHWIKIVKFIDKDRLVLPMRQGTDAREVLKERDSVQEKVGKVHAVNVDLETFVRANSVDEALAVGVDDATTKRVLTLLIGERAVKSVGSIQGSVVGNYRLDELERMVKLISELTLALAVVDGDVVGGDEGGEDVRLVGSVLAAKGGVAPERELAGQSRGQVAMALVEMAPEQGEAEAMQRVGLNPGSEQQRKCKAGITRFVREAEVRRACGKACDGGVKERVVEDWERWKFRIVMCQPGGGISEGGGQARAGADSALCRSQGGWLRRSQLGLCGIFGVGKGSALIFPSSLCLHTVFVTLILLVFLIKSSWQWPLVGVLISHVRCACTSVCAHAEVGMLAPPQTVYQVSQITDQQQV